LVHVGGFNLGLFMRTRFGIGTPRSLQGRVALLIALWMHLLDHWRDCTTSVADHSFAFTPHHRFGLLPVGASEGVL
jgi:hypothetical protein